MSETTIMHCGACSAEVQVTREQQRNDSVAPCPSCPDGGVDFEHARRHANID